MMDNQRELILCQTIGEPFYLADLAKYRDATTAFKQAFSMYFPQFEIGYSYKTNPLAIFCREANRIGAYAEVVSSEELSWARHLGVPGERVIFNGPCKDEDSINWCIDHGALVNIDSWGDLAAVERAVLGSGRELQRIGVRVNFTSMGLVSRFGFDVSCPLTVSVFRRLTAVSPDCEFVLHSHVADRSLESVETQAAGMSQFYLTLLKQDICVSGFNLGGGFMSSLSDSLRSSLGIEQVSFGDYAATFHRVFDGYGIDVRSFDFYAEPGTAVVAGSLSLFGQVVDLKERPDGTLIANTNLSRFDAYARATLPDLPCRLLTDRVLQKSKSSILLAGYTCIESDILHTCFPHELKCGDWIVFDDVGSYSTVFKPPFIKGSHLVLSLKESGEVYIERNRQSWDQMFTSESRETRVL
jgi:diaminopimelate decarboxylase